MPVHASLSKQAATKSYGATIILKGENLQESIETASALAMNGALFIHPYDDPDIIAGQGTIGIEIMEDLQSSRYYYCSGRGRRPYQRYCNCRESKKSGSTDHRGAGSGLPVSIRSYAGS